MSHPPSNPPSSATPEPYHRRLEWLTRLQRITAALASAATRSDIGRIVIEEALPALQAVIGVVAVLEADGRTLTNVQFQGVSAETQGAWCSYPIDSPVPVAEAALRGAPIIVGTRQERNLRYPALAAVHGPEHGGSVLAYPLLQGGRVLGSLGLCFEGDHTPDALEQSYLTNLAQQCATALARIHDQEARTASERTLQLVSDLAPVYIASCDRQHRFKFVNKSYARLWQRPAADLVGRHVRDVLGEAAYLSLLPHIEQVLKGRAVDFTVEVSFPETGPRWLESRYVPEIDEHGEVQGWIATILDITESKKAEEVLRSRERELSLIYRNVSDIVFLLAVDELHRFRFVTVNHAFLNATGLCEADVAGKPVAEVIPEPSYSLVIGNYERAIRERTTVTWEEVTPYPSGTKRGVVAVTPLFDSQGVCTNLVGTVHDVTELKRAESALLEADRRKDEFLAMLAHELRNPLGPIRNGVQLLRKLSDDKQAMTRIWDMIERQSTHMSRLVDDLLDVSRITRGRIFLRHEELELCELVSATAHDYESQFHQKNVSLLVSTPRQPIYVLGDRTRIAQSVGNLLHNAQKFTYSGGVTTVTLTEDEQWAIITVADSGIGMDALTMSRLFVPFAQADQSLERSAGGLGLGLSLVQGLVHLHSGTVTAKSDGLGRGSTLQIRLPLIRLARSTEAGGQQAPTPRSQRVLIIEDNADAAESLRLLLTLAGHAALIAANGPAALKLLESESPDLIICDIGLPGGMSGYDLARAVRSLPRFQATFMVALTGYGQEDDKHAALTAGFNLHLTKPMDPEKLDSLMKLAPRVPTAD